MNKELLNSSTDGNGTIYSAEHKMTDANRYVPPMEGAYYARMGAVESVPVNFEIKEARTTGGDSDRRGKSIDTGGGLKLGSVETCGW